ALGEPHTSVHLEAELQVRPVEVGFEAALGDETNVALKTAYASRDELVVHQVLDGGLLVAVARRSPERLRLTRCQGGPPGLQVGPASADLDVGAEGYRTLEDVLHDLDDLLGHGLGLILGGLQVAGVVHREE